MNSSPINYIGARPTGALVHKKKRANPITQESIVHFP